MSKPDTWMPFYIGDYLRDTSRLTVEQHGAYVLLIFDYWMKGPPPDDSRVLRAITKTSVSQWRAISPVLKPYFTVTPTVEWRHKRIDEVKEEQEEKYRRRQEAGKAGGEAARGRSGRKTENGKTIAKVIANPIANELQNNSISEPESDEAKASSDARTLDEQAFAQICGLLGLNANDARNWGDFFDVLRTTGVSRETLVDAAKKARSSGARATSLSYLRPIACELRDRAAAAGPAPVIFQDCDDDEWKGRLRAYLSKAIWVGEWGPPPGSDGCKVPAPILAEMTQPQRQKASA